MPPDTIQIGSLVVSKIVFDVITNFISVIIGGSITYWATRSAETRRWNQQKQDKRQEQQREAISLALDWIDPIERAVNKASTLASSFLHQTISEDSFKSRWPNLLDDLSKLDIPMKHRVFLSQEAYLLGYKIIDQLDTLQFVTLHLQTTKEGQKQFTENINQLSDLITDIKTNVKALKTGLMQEYKATFE